MPDTDDTASSTPWTFVPLNEVEEIAASIPDEAADSSLQADCVVIYSTLLLHRSVEGHVGAGKLLEAWTPLWCITTKRRNRGIRHLADAGIIELRHNGWGVPAAVTDVPTSAGVPHNEKPTRRARLSLPSLVAALQARPGRSATRQAAVYIAILLHVGEAGAFPSRATIGRLVGVTERTVNDALKALEAASIIHRKARYRVASQADGTSRTLRTSSLYDVLDIKDTQQAESHGLGWACTRDYEALCNHAYHAS